MKQENGTNYLFEMGQKLRAVRLNKKLTQKQVALDMSCTQSYLSAVELGKKASCTAFVISLIRYYKVPYELIFGEYTNDFSLTCFPEMSKPSVYLNLLRKLVINANSTELNSAIDTYMKMCIYLILRTIYSQNPRNSEKIFTLSNDETKQLALSIISATPLKLESFIKTSESINCKKFEIPVENNGELRMFVKHCEKILKDTK